MPTDKDNIPVSVREQKRLAECEAVISKNFQAFYDVGCALREIRENRYYRIEHDTFEDYCREMWDMLKRTADFQIKAADVVDNLQTKFGEANGNNCSQNNPKNTEDIPFPQNEAQARALSKLKPEDQPRVWLEAINTVPEGGKITASHIKKTIRNMNIASLERIVDEAAKTDIRKDPKEITIKEDRVDNEFRDAFDAFFIQVKKERQNNWRFTEKKVVLRYLEALYTAVKSEV
jgi:hypothetical protein